MMQYREMSQRFPPLQEDEAGRIDPGHARSRLVDLLSEVRPLYRGFSAFALRPETFLAVADSSLIL